MIQYPFGPNIRHIYSMKTFRGPPSLSCRGLGSPLGPPKQTDRENYN